MRVPRNCLSGVALAMAGLVVVACGGEPPAGPTPLPPAVVPPPGPSPGPPGPATFTVRGVVSEHARTLSEKSAMMVSRRRSMRRA